MKTLSAVVISVPLSLVFAGLCSGQSYTITTVAGGASIPGDFGVDAPAVGALIDPSGVAADGKGNFYISDSGVPSFLR